MYAQNPDNKNQKRRNPHYVLEPLLPDLENDGPGKKPHFEVVDIEASRWTGFLILGHYDGYNYHEFLHLRGYIEFIARKAADRPDGELTVFAHFGGGYDFNFLIRTIFFQSAYAVTNMIERGSGILSFDMTGVSQGVRIKVVFRDSSAILPFALREITRTFEVPHKKKEMDHTKVRFVTKRLREYLRFDCIGLHESLTKYFNWPRFDGVDIRYTIASQALQLWRKFLPRPVYAITKKGIDSFVRSAYVGGRVGIFNPVFDGRVGGRDEGKRISCFDANSLYPTVMRACEYPVAFSHTTNIYEEGSLGVYEAEADIPESMWIPPLPVVTNVNGTRKLIFPTGRVRGRWTTTEINYCRTLGIPVRTGYGVIFENGGHIFRDYVDSLYAQRLKAVPKSADDILCKLFMNGLYGRTGLRLDRENLIIDDGREGVEPHMVIKEGGGLNRKIRFVKERKRIRSFSNVAIATFVTAASRVHMHPLYLACGRDLYYTDTDSIFTTHDLGDSRELGAMKREYTAEAAVFLLPKTYIVSGLSKPKLLKWEPDPGMTLPEIARKIYGDDGPSMEESLRRWNRGEQEDDPTVSEREWKRFPLWKFIKFEGRDKVTMKGFISRKVSHFKFEDFKMALEGDLRRLSVTMPPKFAKFRSAGRRGRFVTLLPASPRTIKARYDKRQVITLSPGVYTTSPLVVKMEAPLTESPAARGPKKGKKPCSKNRRSLSLRSSSPWRRAPGSSATGARPVTPFQEYPLTPP